MKQQNESMSFKIWLKKLKMELKNGYTIQYSLIYLTNISTNTADNISTTSKQN